MKRVDSNPVSSTGHQWPCIGFYQTSTEKDRTERCTCGVKDRVMVGQAERRKRWPMRLGSAGAVTGKAVSEDLAGRYQPVTVYQRKSSKLRQLLGIGGWIAGVSYVVAFLTQTPFLVDAIDWVREAPAEQVAGGSVTLVIFWGTCKIIGRAIRIGQNRTRLVYVTSADDEQVRSPQPLLFIGSGTGKTQTETNTQAGGTNE